MKLGTAWNVPRLTAVMDSLWMAAAHPPTSLPTSRLENRSAVSHTSHTVGDDGYITLPFERIRASYTN